jgi:hypothetical protein
MISKLLSGSDMEVWPATGVAAWAFARETGFLAFGGAIFTPRGVRASLGFSWLADKVRTGLDTRIELKMRAKP